MCISKFETMLKTNSIYFFDATEFEGIIQHYLNFGKHSLARKALQLGINQHPSSIALKLLQIELLVFENKLPKAIKLLNEVAIIEPHNEEVFIQRALILSKKKEHSQAILVLNKALEYAEDMFDIWSLLAMEYLYLEDFENARLNFAKCIEEDVEDYSSLHNIIYCFEMDDQFEQAVAFLKSYLDRNPYSEVAWHQLGRQYYALNMFEEALKAFDYAVLIDEFFIGGYIEKAKTLEILKDYEEAIENYLITLELDDPTAFVYTRIGECFEQLNEIGNAIAYYKKAVYEDPLLDRAWGLLTDAYYKIGEYKKASFYSNKALQIDDTNPVYWRKYANISIKLNSYNEAVTAFEKCIDLGDLEIEVYITLSDVLLFLKDYKKALKILISAKKTYREFAEIEYRLCGLFMKLSNEPYALIHLKNALAIDYEYHKIIRELYPMVYEKDSIQKIIISHYNSLS